MSSDRSPQSVGGVTGCWYSYMVGDKPIELCEDCENLLRIKMLEQAAGELFGQQIGRHIKRKRK